MVDCSPYSGITNSRLLTLELYMHKLQNKYRKKYLPSSTCIIINSIFPTIGHTCTVSGTLRYTVLSRFLAHAPIAEKQCFEKVFKNQFVPAFWRMRLYSNRGAGGKWQIRKHKDCTTTMTKSRQVKSTLTCKFVSCHWVWSVCKLFWGVMRNPCETVLYINAVKLKLTSECAWKRRPTQLSTLPFVWAISSSLM